MRRAVIDEGDFKILLVTDENGQFSHFRVADRNEESLSGEKFYIASKAIECGNKIILQRGLLNDNK